MKSFALVLGLLFCAAAQAQDIAVSAHREGESVVVEASVDLPVAAVQAWQTVTDYERLATFIPDMTECKIIIRSGNRVIVEQKGSAAFLLVKRKIEVRLEVEEVPYESVTSKAVAGSFREMVGRYDFIPNGNGTRFKYSGRIVPDFWIPDVFETKAVKRTVEKQFTAMVSEIMRRYANSESTPR